VSRRRPLPALVAGTALFGLGIVAIYAPLVPFSHGPDGAVTPDLLYCVVIAWIVRHPQSAPIWLILPLALLADLMLMRPVGLGALGLLAAAELLRARRERLRDQPFLAEWLAAAAAFAAVLASVRLALQLSFLEPPSMRDLADYWLSTALAYPFVAGLLQFGLGVRLDRGRRSGLAAGRGR
jgi:rod shape-determining protein MreD